MPFPKGFRFRSATVADQPEVCRLFAEVHREYGFEADFESRDRDLLDIEQCYPADAAFFGVLVEESGGRIVATAALKPKDTATAELARLYLRAEYRGLGLGRGLTLAILIKARELGYRRVILETHTDCRKAVALYEKLGLTPIPLPPGMIRPTPITPPN